MCGCCVGPRKGWPILMRSSFVLFCFCFCFFSPRSLENESEKADEELSREVVVTDTPIGLQVTTVMTYHKELPPLTRLLRHLTAYFTAGSSPPPSEN